MKRCLKALILDPKFGRQMRFILGPRQTGKTALALQILSEKSDRKLYFNWDARTIREHYIKDPYFFQDVTIQKNITWPWMCLDEIHKYPNWKNILKDYFDIFNQEFRFLVTGSARLDLFRHSGDSLAGRYLLFNLNPLTVMEVLDGNGLDAACLDFGRLINKALKYDRSYQNIVEELLQFSGFPEPFLKKSVSFHRRWRAAYIDTLIQEDLRDLTNIKNRENIVVLLTLLQERVSALLSIEGLAKILEVNYATAKNYIQALRLTFVIFLLTPYSKSISRGILKQPKVYFYDWTRPTEAGARFENFIALHLKSFIDYFNDSGLSLFELRFVRTKDGKETDFLILNEGNPYLLIEAKLKKSKVDKHHFLMQEKLGGIPFVQVVLEKGVQRKEGVNQYQLSAEYFFAAMAPLGSAA